ncbi:glucosaminidase domain-containing protein [Faecalibacterium prausnitzii]|uniref:glucosaminidase domain-containing protein n=1 Tax=Faecalibacterium prausnitzii TaxID=853 RepID=UPI002665FB0E|nr:glucosaminidase domain-containing protein [Faecalibacterium prausnitzii]
MAYTNSPLVVYTNLSPNHSGQRTHSIDRITPHCVVGQLSAESICGCFISPSRQASCNYGIGKDGRVSLCVEEKNRSWCSSSVANDQRAITIECASDLTHPYAMNSAVYTSLIKLCTDICKRNGKTKLLWLGDKNKTLNYAPASDEMVLTVHRWYANKACPGDWLYSRLSDLAAKVTAALGTPVASTGLQAASLRDMESAEVVTKVATLFTANQKQSGILASVSMAQFVLESGYGKSELAQNANNCFGMKSSLSGNSWAGSAWDGHSVYTMQTGEQNTDGSYVTVTTDFRKYGSIEDSIADHSAYLLGAMNGSKKRYEGLAGCTDYKKAVQIIKDGGYATSLDYVQNLCRVIEQWNLTQFDVAASVTPVTPAATLYRVRKNWSDTASQKGAFRDLSNAKACADKNPGYSVFDENGKAVYPTSTAFQPYTVRVSISDLRIRKGPGTNYGSRGFTGKGVFTIVAEATGKGASKWGLLKSFAGKRNGWISLDYVKKV